MSRQEELETALAASSEALGFVLSAEQFGLTIAHATMLLDANERTNLTRIREPGLVIQRHFVESFLAAELWGPAPADRPLRVLDIGAGGGFPGLAGRIVRSDVALTCLEPRAAKAAFLSRVAAGLPEPRPRILSRRIEEFHVEQTFDVATFRALAVGIEQIEPFLSDSGLIVGFPGGEETWSSAIEAAGWSAEKSLPLPNETRQVTRWSRTH